MMSSHLVTDECQVFNNTKYQDYNLQSVVLWGMDIKEMDHHSSKLHCIKRHFVPNRYNYLFETNNIVQSDWNYLELKQIMLCNNKFTLKQIDILRRFYVTLIRIDISIWYKVTFLQCIDSDKFKIFFTGKNN